MKEEVDLEETKLSGAIKLNVACLVVAPRGASERDEKTESRSGSAGAGAGSRVSKGAHERARGSARAGFFLECARKSTTGTSGAVLWQMVIKSRRDGWGGVR